jgi:hypothetical protein
VNLITQLFVVGCEAVAVVVSVTAATHAPVPTFPAAANVAVIPSAIPKTARSDETEIAMRSFVDDDLRTA